MNYRTGSGGLTSGGYRTSEGSGFWNTLRGYERISTPSVTDRYDYFNWAQRTRTGREAEEEVSRGKRIKNVLQRLSEPKHRPKTSFRVKTKRITETETLKGLKEKLMASTNTGGFTTTNQWLAKTPCTPTTPNVETKVVRKLDLTALGAVNGIRVTKHTRSQSATNRVQFANTARDRY